MSEQAVVISIIGLDVEGINKDGVMLKICGISANRLRIGSCVQGYLANDENATDNFYFKATEILPDVITDDGYISENTMHYFRRCNELGLYMRNRQTYKIERFHLDDAEFKKLCYGK